MSCSKTAVAAGRKITTPSDLSDIITGKNNALRALGALLGTARLSEFDSDNYVKGSEWKLRAEDRQSGISQLVDLCLDDIERTIATFAEEYLEGVHHEVRAAASIPDKGQGEVQ